MAVWFPPLLATLVVAFSMAPTQGLWRKTTRRLLGGADDFDARQVMQRAGLVLQSISTLTELLRQIAAILSDAFQTDQVSFWLAEHRHFRRRFPASDSAPPERDAEDPLVRWLLLRRLPLVPDLERRTERHPLLHEAAGSLATLGASAAVGIFSKTGLEGFLLLGRRRSGGIYGADEQAVLQLLCKQLAISLENARLYTQVQEGKLYNEILLESLVSGVIAADEDGRITLFNREAQRLTGLKTSEVLGQPIDVLPAPLTQTLKTTIGNDLAIRDRDLHLPTAGSHSMPIRLSSSIFRGQDGRALGAMIVISDMTVLKQLEEQVRRSDRLASLGTLSAGMAHEIKNPLVSIKTFAQLLPERYEDPDFRTTFSSLIGHEIQRIDSIVNQLLSFARPPPALLAPTPLHAVLAQALQLIDQPVRRKRLHLVRTFDAQRDHVNADATLLHQAFINFLLNAVDATGGGGSITVATHNVQPRRAGAPTGIRVTITDTGDGIAPENLSRIFDPFFSTKSDGTGLGLSVAHGIVTEHEGHIQVSSSVGRGTTITIDIPLLEAEAAS